MHGASRHCDQHADDFEGGALTGGSPEPQLPHLGGRHEMCVALGQDGRHDRHPLSAPQTLQLDELPELAVEFRSQGARQAPLPAPHLHSHEQ